MSGGFDDDGDLDLDAAEYVLGTMGLDERLSFAERIKRETAAGLAVANWEMRLAGLGGRLDAVTPPPQTWERIERAIAGGGATIPFKVIAGGGRQTSDTSVMRRSRDRWRMAAFLSGAAAALLIVALVDRMVRTPPPADAGATFVAAVNQGGAKPALIVRVDMRTREVTVRPVAATAPAGRSLELWYIGDDKVPHSMGVLDKGPLRRVLPEAAKDNTIFAVTVEAPGGSKTGAPTSPPVSSGQLVEE